MSKRRPVSPLSKTMGTGIGGHGVDLSPLRGSELSMYRYTK